MINIDQSWLNARGSGPYYLDQSGKTYQLQTDVVTKGSAFAIVASNVIFDLNGHTITYDNATPIVVPNGSFELGSGTSATGWNASAAPNASRYQGVWLHNDIYDGNFSLKFALPAADQYLTSTSTVTLEANTTYNVSAMFEYGGHGDTINPGVTGYVSLIPTAAGAVHTVSWSDTNWRGIQLQENVFKTGSTAETYILRAGISGGSAGTVPFYIDDIRIQRSQTYGVATQVYAWSPANYPDIDYSSHAGAGTNSTIKNGTILQGADNGAWAHGVFLQEIAGITVQNLNITVGGQNSSAIYGLNLTNANCRINGNTLTSNTKTITSRDNFNGAVIYALQGEIHNNTILNGPHAGIVGGGSMPSNIYLNTIQLKTRYTNAFAILGGNGSLIHDNIINCAAGPYASRGIMASGTSSKPTTLVYNNNVNVQDLSNNQEYEGQAIGGTYGIQLENGDNIEVYANSVTAYGNVGVAYAFRQNTDEGLTGQVYVHDNLFQAISQGAHAGTVRLSEVKSASLLFEDNTLITNDSVIGSSSDSIATLTGSHIQINAPINDPYPVESDYSSNPGLHTMISLLDSSFADAASLAYLETATTRTASRFGGAVDNKMAFGLQWTTVIQVKSSSGAALADAQVTITDKFGSVVFSGMSDANGKTEARLYEFKTQGATKTIYSPYTVTAASSGKQGQQQFTANKMQTVQVQLAP